MKILFYLDMTSEATRLRQRLLKLRRKGCGRLEVPKKKSDNVAGKNSEQTRSPICFSKLIGAAMETG